MLIVINEFRVQPGQAAAFEGLFRRVAELILREPGCLSCKLHRDRADPQTYVSYLEWASEAALAAPHDPAIAELIARYPLQAPPLRRRFDLVPLE